jgi:hypothetical protein
VIVTVVAGMVVTPLGSVTVTAGKTVVPPGRVMVACGKVTVVVVTLEQPSAIKGTMRRTEQIIGANFLFISHLPCYHN